MRTGVARPCCDTVHVEPGVCVKQNMHCSFEQACACRSLNSVAAKD